MSNRSKKDNAAKKLSREEIAKIEIGQTSISKNLTIVVCILFLALVLGYPLLQAGYEIVSGGKKFPQSWDIFRSFSVPPEFSESKNLLDNFTSGNKQLLTKINKYEDELEDSALMRKYLLPPAQGTLLKLFKTGNEKVFVGNDGYIFFQAGFEYLTNSGFLAPNIMKKRFAKAKIAVDPRKAILQFKEQLAARGIDLIIIPMTIKPMIYPDKFSAFFKNYPTYLQNPSFEEFKKVECE